MKQFLWKNSFLLHLQLTGHNFLFSHFIQIIFDSRAKVAHSSCLFCALPMKKIKFIFFSFFYRTDIDKEEWLFMSVCLFVFGKVFTSYWHFSWTSNFFLHTFSQKKLWCFKQNFIHLLLWQCEVMEESLSQSFFF